MSPVRCQAITWTNADPGNQRIYAAVERDDSDDAYICLWAWSLFFQVMSPNSRQPLHVTDLTSIETDWKNAKFQTGKLNWIVSLHVIILSIDNAIMSGIMKRKSFTATHDIWKLE